MQSKYDAMLIVRTEFCLEPAAWLALRETRDGARDHARGESRGAGSWRGGRRDNAATLVRCT